MLKKEYTIYNLAEDLQDLGYQVAVVVTAPIDSVTIEIEQDTELHYLSWAEALALLDAALNHPVNLNDWAEDEGLCRTYHFPEVADD